MVMKGVMQTLALIRSCRLSSRCCRHLQVKIILKDSGRTPSGSENKGYLHIDSPSFSHLGCENQPFSDRTVAPPSPSARRGACGGTTPALQGPPCNVGWWQSQSSIFGWLNHVRPAFLMVKYNVKSPFPYVKSPELKIN